MKIFRSVISSRGTWRLYFLGIKIFSVKRKLPSICVDAKNDVSVPKLKYLKVSVHGKNNKIYVTSDMDENTRISLMVFGNNNVIRINTKRFINADIIIGLNDVKIENAFLLIDDETSINGVKIFVINAIGFATINAVLSGCWIATDLGINSPITTCKNVIKENAIVTATECVANERIDSGKNPKTGSIILTRVASPTHPRPILAIVMPN